MKQIRKNYLSDLQKNQVLQLLDECTRHDGCRGSFSEPDISRYYLSFSVDGSLNAILTVCQGSEYEAEIECAAYTAPAKRRKGCFTALLELCAADYPETDLIFPVNHRSEDALHTMAALAAEVLSTEYRMEYPLSNHISSGETDSRSSRTNSGSASPGTSRTISDIVGFQSNVMHNTLELKNTDNHIWQLVDHTAPQNTPPIAQCKTMRSGTGICLYEVETAPAFRNHGYASAMLNMLFTALIKQGASHVFLHVTGSNHAAIALYQKKGFRITETLSYYLY